MKKILYSLLSVATLTYIQPLVQAYTIVENQNNFVRFSDIISPSFIESGTWHNEDNDKNTLDWARTNSNPYVSTYARNIKNSEYIEKFHPKIEFNINFTKLGGTYYETKKQYDLNVLSNVIIQFKTQSGQPAHNKSIFWGETIENWSILDLINSANPTTKIGNIYSGGQWSNLKHEVNTSWNSDKSNLKITWKINYLQIKATKWTDAIWFRVQLKNHDMLIPKL